MGFNKSPCNGRAASAYGMTLAIGFACGLWFQQGATTITTDTHPDPRPLELLTKEPRRRPNHVLDNGPLVKAQQSPPQILPPPFVTPRPEVTTTTTSTFQTDLQEITTTKLATPTRVPPLKISESDSSTSLLNSLMQKNHSVSMTATPTAVKVTPSTAAASFKYQSHQVEYLRTSEIPVVDKVPTAAVHCAKENWKCECVGVIYFGTQDKWTRQRSHSSMVCNHHAFGDPIRARKACWCLPECNTTTRNSSIDSSATAPSSSEYTRQRLQHAARGQQDTSEVTCHDPTLDRICVGVDCNNAVGQTSTSSTNDVPVIALVVNQDLTPKKKNKKSSGEGLMLETLSLVHSILDHEPRPLHFVFVTDWQTKADGEILSWFTSCDNNYTAMARKLIVEVIELPEQRIRDAIDNLQIKGTGPLSHHSGVGGVSKFYLPDILAHHSKVIVYDTDVVVGKPISILWDHFNNFAQDHILATTNLMTEGGYETSVCSCLTLMNLERMRAIGWTIGHEWLNSHFRNKELAGKGGIGDQALNSMIYSKHPQLMVMLPRIWMLSLCQYLYGYKDPVGVGTMDPKGGDQSWGAIHFNCEPPSGHGEWPEWRNKFQQAYRIRDYFDTQVVTQKFKACAASTQP
eukprot:m.180055 g.180055  ORF g.180055 m.180055 type:complete len:629 (+) comp32001_c0_seq2:506-2392(+)